MRQACVWSRSRDRDECCLHRAGTGVIVLITIESTNEKKKAVGNMSVLFICVSGLWKQKNEPEMLHIQYANHVFHLVFVPTLEWFVNTSERFFLFV